MARMSRARRRACSARGAAVLPAALLAAAGPASPQPVNSEPVCEVLGPLAPGPQAGWACIAAGRLVYDPRSGSPHTALLAGRPEGAAAWSGSRSDTLARRPKRPCGDRGATRVARWNVGG